MNLIYKEQIDYFVIMYWLCTYIGRVKYTAVHYNNNELLRLYCSLIVWN
jgi:hypothetical protein